MFDTTVKIGIAVSVIPLDMFENKRSNEDLEKLFNLQDNTKKETIVAKNAV